MQAPKKKVATGQLNDGHIRGLISESCAKGAIYELAYASFTVLKARALGIQPG